MLIKLVTRVSLVNMANLHSRKNKSKFVEIMPNLAQHFAKNSSISEIIHFQNEQVIRLRRSTKVSSKLEEGGLSVEEERDLLAQKVQLTREIQATLKHFGTVILP